MALGMHVCVGRNANMTATQPNRPCQLLQGPHTREGGFIMRARGADKHKTMLGQSDAGAEAPSERKAPGIKLQVGETSARRRQDEHALMVSEARPPHPPDLSRSVSEGSPTTRG